MFDRIDRELISVLLEQGCTLRALRNLRTNSGGPMFNYTSAKKHLCRLVEKGCVKKNVEPGATRRDKIDPKTIYSIGKGQLRRIIEEEAKSSGKLQPSLSLEDLKGLISASKGWSSVKLDKVEFDLVYYQKDESRFKKIEKGLVWKPGPLPQSPIADYENLTGLSQQIFSAPMNKTRTFVLPRSRAGPVLTALAKEQSEALQTA